MGSQILGLWVLHVAKVSAILIPSLIGCRNSGVYAMAVWDDLMVTIAHIHPLYLAFAVLICALAWVMRGWRYQAILGGLTVRLGLTFSTACILSQTANLIVPARLGDLVRSSSLNTKVWQPTRRASVPYRRGGYLTW